MDIILDMVVQSCNIKRLVVENDPMEKGERALLNYGHTLGHAIEKIMDFQLLHGECVAIGCILASIISKNKGFLTAEEVADITKSFQVFGFEPLPKEIDISAIIKATKNDKKMKAGRIKFVLLNKIGEAYIDSNVSDQDMENAIQELLAN